VGKKQGRQAGRQAVQCSAVQCSAVQCNTVQYSAVGRQGSAQGAAFLLRAEGCTAQFPAVLTVLTVHTRVRQEYFQTMATPGWQ
jgi:hypothetical protein